MDSKKNFASTVVLTAPTPAGSGVSLVVAVGGGALLPAVPFNAVVWPIGVLPLAVNAEIVRVTAIVGDTLTIVRQQEGTAARTILIGDQLAATINEKDLGEPTARDAPQYDVYVPSGKTLLVGDELDAATNNIEVFAEGEIVVN